MRLVGQFVFEQQSPIWLSLQLDLKRNGLPYTVDTPYCTVQYNTMNSSLQWRHNWCDGVSNHQPHDCVLNRLFRHRSKLRVTGRYVGNSPVTGEFSTMVADGPWAFGAEHLRVQWWPDLCIYTWPALKLSRCMQYHTLTRFVSYQYITSKHIHYEKSNHNLKRGVNFAPLFTLFTHASLHRHITTGYMHLD